MLSASILLLIKNVCLQYIQRHYREHKDDTPSSNSVRIDYNTLRNRKERDKQKGLYVSTKNVDNRKHKASWEDDTPQRRSHDYAPTPKSHLKGNHST